jgi:hypothetical protein
MTDVSAAAKARVLIVGVGPGRGTVAPARLGADVMVINQYPNRYRSAPLRDTARARFNS